MNDCVFCKIVAGDIPCYKVYEDEHFLAFLNLNPRVEGHTLVVPKQHFRWTYDVPNFGEYWLVTKNISQNIQTILEAKWSNFFTHGQVPHAHIHILPRKDDVATADPLPRLIKTSAHDLEMLMHTLTK